MNLNKLKIVTCKAEEFPTSKAKIRPLAVGEKFGYPSSASDKVYKVGDYFQDNDCFMVTKVFYMSKKWWQFWKRRQIAGYEVTCIRDITNKESA